MMTAKIPMTRGGEKKLAAELHHLKTVERPRIIEAIAEARAHGDLKENAEYHAAREQQSFTEGRIAELESKLSQAHVIDVTNIPQDGKVVFGVTVELIHLENDSKVTYQIVGDDESDIKAGKIAISTPIARALIGKHKSDVVLVKTPSGEIEYEIADVKYIEK